MTDINRFESLQQSLEGEPRRWLVTGVAGFIGSNLLEKLLKWNQQVVGVDNFATGKRSNLNDVRSRVGETAWQRFQFVEGDITKLADCQAACANVEFVLHQAALGSVPRSLANPLATHHANVTGFLNIIETARHANVERIVYASSSSVYGDHPCLPKVEGHIGEALSPYAVSKFADELYAKVFTRSYGLSTVGLRYFNVFGRRQDPEGAYAAVIPRWFRCLLSGESCRIFGDGETSRDFTHVSNVVQANLLAATSGGDISGKVFNVACGGRLTLRQLHDAISAVLLNRGELLEPARPIWEPFRPGDIQHSLADISLIREFIGYEPTCTLTQGLQEAADWYVGRSFAEVRLEAA